MQPSTSAAPYISETASCFRGEDSNQHLTLKAPCHRLLEMVLQRHVEIESVPSVPEANSYESAATCRQETTLRRLKFFKSTMLKQGFSVLTVVILYPQDEVSAGVADRFQCNTGILLHWCLGKQLPCSARGGR